MDAQSIFLSGNSIEMEEKMIDFRNKHFTELPCAAKGLNSYRYLGRYGWIMIGAKTDADALDEAKRSTDNVTLYRLEYWNGQRYVPVA